MGAAPQNVSRAQFEGQGMGPEQKVGLEAAAQAQSGHTRSQVTCSRIAVGENRVGRRREWLR